MAAHGGYVYKMIGDAFQAAFSKAPAAVAAAIDGQRRLQGEDWGETPIRVRMALHTGETEERGDDYVGPALEPRRPGALRRSWGTGAADPPPASWSATCFPSGGGASATWASIV